MHALTHVLISLLIMAPFTLVGLPFHGATLASGFYTIREFYQYFALNKRHRGRFDYEGCLPVIVVTFTLAYFL